MGSISIFHERIDRQGSTVLLSILSRIALVGDAGLPADRIVAIAGLTYLRTETYSGNRQRRSSSSAIGFLTGLEKTGFVVKFDRWLKA